MAHRLYVCEGLILASHDFGEANRLYYILTAEFGRIIALAQGVRYLKSKLRYHLREGNFVTVTLIRGREFWRVVGVTGEDFRIESREAQEIMARWQQLVLRLVRGEGSVPVLFGCLREGRHLLATLEPPLLADCELMIVWQILDALGYIGNSTPVTALEQVRANRQSMLATVNQALAASQL